MSGRLIGPLFDVLCEMEAAERKHGERFMGNLPEQVPGSTGAESLRFASAVGGLAKFGCEHKAGARFDVLMEEVGEVADAILDGVDPTAELTQVAAMVLAWLDVDAAAVKDALGLMGPVGLIDGGKAGRT